MTTHRERLIEPQDTVLVDPVLGPFVLVLSGAVFILLVSDWHSAVTGASQTI
jgi:hypothetical protein